MAEDHDPALRIKNKTAVLTVQQFFSYVGIGSSCRTLAGGEAPAACVVQHDKWGKHVESHFKVTEIFHEEKTILNRRYILRVWSEAGAEF